jgi:uncharacterized membrane protein
VKPENDENFPWLRVSNIALIAAVFATICALLRFDSYHNDTFDLAFYHRLLWGLARGDNYQPLTDSHVLGLHASWILWPLSALARVIPAVPLMLVVQAASLSAAAIPLARIAARHLRTPWAADVTALLYLLYPTVFTAASYEFHPSALAMFPLVYALDTWESSHKRTAAIALVLAATCREDVALVTALVAFVWAQQAQRSERRLPLTLAFGMLAYFVVYEFVIAPRYMPTHGSLALHFSQLGSTPFAIVVACLLHPIAALKSVATAGKWLYVPRLLAPLAFLPLLSPRWLVPALAPIAINFLSAWPTAIQPRSHYSLLIVPFLLIAAIHGAARVVDAKHALATPAQRPSGRRMLVLTASTLLCASLVAQYRNGATPLSRHWNTQQFTNDSRATSLREIERRVRPSVLVVAPDELLAHIADRPVFQRLDHWTRSTDDLVLGLRHRGRFALTQEAWRCAEERLVRNILGGARYGAVYANNDYILLRRGVSPRAYAAQRYLQFEPDSWNVSRHTEIDASLALASWRLEPLGPASTKLTLWLVNKRRWPQDLGLEFGWGHLVPHEDRLDPVNIAAFVPFDGLFNPAHVRVGEVARTSVVLAQNSESLQRQTLYLGARRIDGSRLHADSRHWVPLNP